MSDITKPQQSLGIPPNVPPQPLVSSLHEFLSMSPEQQAAMLHAWQGFWLKATPAVDVRSGSSIVISEPPARIETENWKQSPTQAERASLKDWNKS